MAIYHLEAKVISRGAGRSAVAAAAYMSCSQITNEYDGVQHDYTRKQGLVWQQIFLPEYAPAEWSDRAVLWNAVEENEKTRDSRLAREFVVALPIEMENGNKERREYYLAILRLAPNRRCPICGVYRAETLDHYLPKSKVPTLAVDPGNLIPACDRCNRKKRDRLSHDPRKMPVHIYYDRIPVGKWLHVKLGDHLEAEYYTECPDTDAWEPGIRSRVGRHLEIYHLAEVYEDEAAEELAIMKDAWTTELRHLREDSEDELPGEAIREEFREFIVKRRESFELGDENSFESAFYRAVEQSMETAYAFFGL